MAYISTLPGVPGIRSLVMFPPETGKYLYELAQTLLRGPSTISEGDRELIAAYVSSRNACVFCMNSHAAAARVLLGDEKARVDQTLGQLENASIAPKLQALLKIAGKVQISGREVSAEDREIHDAVLIAAAFSMFNRYVDGLDTRTPTDPEAYAEMGQRMALNGYVLPNNI